MRIFQQDILCWWGIQLTVLILKPHFKKNNNNINIIFILFDIFYRVSSTNAGEAQNLSFCKGLKLLESNCVENVLQVGK